jgi:hypothetical protein
MPLNAGEWIASWLGWNGPGHAVPSKTKRVAHLALLALIACIFLIDFAYLPLRGEADTLFQPIYRVRQTLAVAISRMQGPAATGYTAHASVVESLNQSGMAVFPNDPGPPYDDVRTNALLGNGEELNEVMRTALATPVDIAREPELILGNELAYADFFSLSFLLFGFNVTSLYYFTFLLLGLSSLAFVVEFRRRPTMLAVLGLFLAGVLFLHGYAPATTHNQLHVIQNSRAFDALSLIAALHLVAAACRGAPLTAGRVTGLVVQAAIFAFLLACRSAVLWQFAFMASVGVALVALVLFRRGQQRFILLTRHAMPVIIAAIAVFGYLGTIGLSRSDAYEDQSNTHVLWHNVLVGVLDFAPDVEQLYLGTTEGESDQLAYDAVMVHLNAIDDSSSPISFRVEGRIYIQPQRDWTAYDEIAKDVVLEIVAQHPGSVLRGMLSKLSLQSAWYIARSRAVEPLLLIGSGALAVLSLALGAFAGGMKSGKRQVSVALLGLMFIAFSTAPALIMPAPINVGTLLTWVILLFIVAGFVLRAVWDIIRGDVLGRSVMRSTGPKDA